MSTKSWLRSTLIVTALTASILPLAGAARGEPGGQAPELHDFQAEHSEKPDVDNRQGRVAPPASLRLAGPAGKIRWNALGTPAAIVSAEPLAEGLGSDPAQAARAYLKANEAVFGLTAEAVDALETVAVNPIGAGAAVLLRQRFGDLPAGVDGLVAIGVSGGQIRHVTSSLSRRTEAPPAARITAQQAMEIAARDGGIDLASAVTKQATPVAVPAPDGVHSAYQVVLIGGARGAEAGFTTHVDAVSGAVITRENLVDHHQDPDNPRWDVFPANPPGDYSSRDTRQTWCHAPGPRCDEATGGDPATGKPWDVDHVTNEPTFTSLGNAARTFENRASGDPFTVGTRPNVLTPSRNYQYPWKNTWYEAKCDPAVFDQPGEADLEAAIANLNAMHNRMHDWSYRLGFTETAWNMQADNGGRGGLGNDPEQGNAQAGARILTVRDNANQITGPDGTAPITNMYLWQPIAGSFYSPCVDGDYDMSVIGHEYTHAISGRMIGGPNAGWSGPQAGAMNESTSDLFSMEQLFEYGYRPAGDTPYVTGGYVTGDKSRGIRNYDMSKSPLNYSDLGYDIVGTQVHADGEIWSATQFDVRAAFVKRYGQGSARQQLSCAEGRTPVDRCPGNRRWAQLSFDALLLMASGAVDYVDHRDALLAADMIRFGGANQDIMWRAFAEHGLGSTAASNGPADADATPSFVNPAGKNGSLQLKPLGEAKDAALRLYVGDYEARAVPVADTDPATELGDTVEMTPGLYDFVVVGAGFGHKRLKYAVVPGVKLPLPLVLSRNLASAANGAAATGDGVNQALLIDDTEATNWASRTGAPAGKSVVVDLAGDEPVKVRRVQVSAMLRPGTDPADPGTQNRFSSLRSFEVLACSANCADPASFTKIYTSKADAFDTTLPRPRGADLLIKSFDVRSTSATHLMLRALTTQCTGNPRYAGEQDHDPNSATDCGTASPVREHVRAAEFQAFSH
ncbi:M36 family metallopeptidase [Nonomuraea gerenzanensis]|uniref:Peptidase M36, fungalysin n=1 Tax=Nonomuraea gerenzanensis TaxID=93944 RepID=A0A1M4E4N7_9ACTN|nr:M36 family metallopeptidase [Nonomuraea gerenzanensis]UBU16009.1 M36 family metallopeptidase [Nonomuraea gerenzanensis]SBO93809.1 peptidase M36, fungalysin [Nonomuraea gerenzanensis]